MKIPWKCHNYEAQLSRGTKRRRDEEQIITKPTPHIYETTDALTNKNCTTDTAMERLVGKTTRGGYGGGGAQMSRNDSDADETKYFRLVRQR